MKSIILIGGEKDREMMMVKKDFNEIYFPVMPRQELPLTNNDMPVNVDYDIVRYRATDLHFGTSQVFLLDGNSQHEFLMRAATHYIRDGGI